MRKSLLPALAAFTALALACGGGEVSEPATAPTATEAATDAGSEAQAPAAGAVAGDSFAKWANPDDDASKALKARGWKVDYCEKYAEGDVYFSCEAGKGELWVEVDVTDYESTQDAKWMAEDDPTVVRDGKRTLEVTLYDASSAKAFGEMVLPKGGKISELSTSAAEKVLTGKGWSVIESSTSKDDGYVYGEIIGMKGDNLILMEWELPEGDKSGNEERETEEGLFYVSQGDDSWFSVAVMDQVQAVALIKELGG